MINPDQALKPLFDCLCIAALSVAMQETVEGRRFLSLLPTALRSSLGHAAAYSTVVATTTAAGSNTGFPAVTEEEGNNMSPSSVNARGFRDIASTNAMGGEQEGEPKGFDGSGNQSQQGSQDIGCGREGAMSGHDGENDAKCLPATLSVGDEMDAAAPTLAPAIHGLSSVTSESTTIGSLFRWHEIRAKAVVNPLDGR